jgi:hypothetical protein
MNRHPLLRYSARAVTAGVAVLAIGGFAKAGHDAVQFDRDLVDQGRIAHETGQDTATLTVSRELMQHLVATQDINFTQYPESGHTQRHDGVVVIAQ